MNTRHLGLRDVFVLVPSPVPVNNISLQILSVTPAEWLSMKIT